MPETTAALTQAQITPLGALLAVTFATAMISLIWWMFHVPPPVPALVARVRRSVEAVKTILVPTTGALHSKRAVELAARLGSDQKAEIILTHVIEVPFVLPLNAPLPDAEKKAREALDEAVALVALHDLPVQTRIQRSRSAGAGIVQAARDVGAEMIVISVRPSGGDNQDAMGATANWLLRRTPCELIIDRVPG
ncbi:MAG: universal stress protein [Firmicutes bacterium]|nr:universal stress protein [Bacillota bacterium]